MWKPIDALAEHFTPNIHQSGLPPVFTVRFAVAPEEAAGLMQEVQEETRPAFEAVVKTWRETDAHAARARLLASELNAANHKAGALKADAAKIRQGIDHALYAGTPSDAMYAKLDHVGKDAARIADQIGSMERLLAEAKAQAKAGLVKMLEAERRTQLERLQADFATAGENLGGSASSLAADYFVKAQAFQSIQFPSATEQYVADAA
jgi:hypothetical protein